MNRQKLHVASVKFYAVSQLLDHIVEQDSDVDPWQFQAVLQEAMIEAQAGMRFLKSEAESDKQSDA